MVHDFRINPLADEGTLAEISYFDGLHRKQFARICIELLLVYGIVKRQGEKLGAVDKRKNWYSFIVRARVLNNTFIEFRSFQRARSECDW